MRFQGQGKDEDEVKDIKFVFKESF